VQYLTQPVAVFAAVNRVLRPGGIFVVSFSNRCFPTKAIAAWLAMHDRQHVALVVRYFELAGGWHNLNTYFITPGTHDPLFIIQGLKA
jgi:SAM-dependent methyltransferase